MHYGTDSSHAITSCTAKNVGMRRAKGEFVLVTNGDVLLGEALIGIISNRKLDKDSFYRIDRHDLFERYSRSANKIFSVGT